MIQIHLKNLFSQLNCKPKDNPFDRIAFLNKVVVFESEFNAIVFHFF